MNQILERVATFLQLLLFYKYHINMNKQIRKFSFSPSAIPFLPVAIEFVEPGRTFVQWCSQVLRSQRQITHLSLDQQTMSFSFCNSISNDTNKVTLYKLKNIDHKLNKVKYTMVYTDAFCIYLQFLRPAKTTLVQKKALHY